MAKEKKLFYSEFWRWTDLNGKTHVYGGYADYDEKEYEDESPKYNNDVWDGMADYFEERGLDFGEVDCEEPEIIDTYIVEYEEDDMETQLKNYKLGLNDDDERRMKIEQTFEDKLKFYEKNYALYNFLNGEAVNTVTKGGV